MGCSFCQKSNIILNTELSFLKVPIRKMDSEANLFSEQGTDNYKYSNNPTEINNLKSVCISPIINRFDAKTKNNFLIDKLLANIKGFLFRKKYEEYLKTQLMDHTNELYFQFIFLTKNFKSSKLLNNKEDEYLINIMKIGWEFFYNKDPTINIRNNINNSKKYNNGLIFKYKNKNFDSNDIDQCLKNVEYCYKGSIDLITNKKCGYGELINMNGSQEIGTFYNDEFCGWNIYVKSNGILYIGLFDKDILNGHGLCFNNENKYFYKGLFKDFQKEGYGTEDYEGNQYRGDFKEDKKFGNGEIIFKNKDVYRGEFANDAINGFGNYIWENNKKEYRGNFSNGKIDGKGFLKWGDDMYYKGMFRNGIKEGEGEFGYFHEEKFFFDFKNDLPFGEGYYLNKNNEKCPVIYNNGKIIDIYDREIIFLFE